MKYAGIIYNDFAAAPGVSLSFFVQGCHQHCVGCQNQETWDFNGGYEFTQGTIDKIIKGLTANGINRTLCIMGGEPLDIRNQAGIYELIQAVKKVLPDTKIYLWTGFIFEEICDIPSIELILQDVDVLIDGPYIDEERDITLPLRGSRNQRVIYLHPWSTQNHE